MHLDVYTRGRLGMIVSDIGTAAILVIRTTTFNCGEQACMHRHTAEHPGQDEQKNKYCRPFLPFHAGNYVTVLISELEDIIPRN